MNNPATDDPSGIIEISVNDLPLHCPLPNQPTWNAHPRVFLPIEKQGQVICPYCSQAYRLQKKTMAH